MESCIPQQSRGTPHSSSKIPTQCRPDAGSTARGGTYVEAAGLPGGIPKDSQAKVTFPALLLRIKAAAVVVHCDLRDLA